MVGIESPVPDNIILKSPKITIEITETPKGSFGKESTLVSTSIISKSHWLPDSQLCCDINPISTFRLQRQMKRSIKYALACFQVVETEHKAANQPNLANIESEVTQLSIRVLVTLNKKISSYLLKICSILFMFDSSQLIPLALSVLSQVSCNIWHEVMFLLLHHPSSWVWGCLLGVQGLWKTEDIWFSLWNFWLI